MKPDDPCWRVAQECTAAALRRTSREVSAVFDQAMAPIGLRSTQFSLLVAVHLASELSLSLLADKLALDRTTLTRNLKPLLRDSLLRHVKSADRRIRRLSLTASGERMVERGLPLWEKAQRSVVKAFGPERWAAFLQELKSMETLIAEGPAARG